MRGKSIVILACDDDSFGLRRTSVYLEDIANRRMVRQKNLLPDNGAIIRETDLYEPIVIGRDDGVGADRAKRRYFILYRVR